MRNTKLAFVLAAAMGFGGAQVASAADMAVKARPMAAPAAFSWTGCYVGAHAGYGLGKNTNDFGKAIASGGTEGGCGNTRIRPL